MTLSDMWKKSSAQRKAERLNPPKADTILGTVLEREKDPKLVRDMSPKEFESYARKALAWTEDFWTNAFTELLNKRYVAPRLVLYDDEVKVEGVESVRLRNASALGNVFLSQAAFAKIEKRLKLPANEADIALVIAHEVGHHVQDLLGKEFKFYAERELQADYLAGLTLKARHTIKPVFEKNDYEHILAVAYCSGNEFTKAPWYPTAIERHAALFEGLQEKDWRKALAVVLPPQEQQR